MTHTSATLNTGKSCPRHDSRMKSVTSPKRTRSIRLPIAPPRMLATPIRARRSLGGTVTAYHATPASASVAMTVNTAVLNGKSIALNIPNAAPVLCTRVRLRKPGITSIVSCSSSARRTIAFVTWSATTIVTTRNNSSLRETAGEVTLEGHRFFFR